MLIIYIYVIFTSIINMITTIVHRRHQTVTNNSHSVNSSNYYRTNAFISGKGYEYLNS